ncbi:MAG: hypothetical protein ACLU5J_04620 [Christensenellales bacterium]
MKLITKNHYDAPSLFDEFFSPYPFGKSYQNGFMRTDISKEKVTMFLILIYRDIKRMILKYN